MLSAIEPTVQLGALHTLFWVYWFLQATCTSPSVFYLQYKSIEMLHFFIFILLACTSISFSYHQTRLHVKNTQNNCLMQFTHNVQCLSFILNVFWFNDIYENAHLKLVCIMLIWLKIVTFWLNSVFGLTQCFNQISKTLTQKYFNLAFLAIDWIMSVNVEIKCYFLHF